MPGDITGLGLGLDTNPIDTENCNYQLDEQVRFHFLDTSKRASYRRIFCVEANFIFIFSQLRDGPR